MHKTLLPAGWPRPKGYANGIAAEGRFVFTAGVIGWDEKETIRSDDFAAQVEQTLLNILAILGEAGAKPQHLVRMTWYVTDKQTYLNSLEGVGAAWRKIMGRVFPCMAVVEVSALVEDKALVEIEATAVVPNEDGA